MLPTCFLPRRIGRTWAERFPGCTTEAQASAQASGNGAAFAQAMASVTTVSQCLYGTASAVADAQATSYGSGGSAVADADAQAFSGEFHGKPIMVRTCYTSPKPRNMILECLISRCGKSTAAHLQVTIKDKSRPESLI